MADAVDAALANWRLKNNQPATTAKTTAPPPVDDPLDSMVERALSQRRDYLSGAQQPEPLPTTPRIPIPGKKPAQDVDELDLALKRASISDPIQAGKIREIVKQTGIDPALLPSDPEQLAFLARQTPEQLLNDAPGLAKFLQQPGNAEVVGRNVSGLSVLESMARQLVGDPMISLLKGAIAVPEAVVGLSDILTGGQTGKTLEHFGFKPREAKQILDTLYSPEQKAANRKLQEAKGFLPTAGTALENPSTIVHTVLESVPGMLGGGAVAQGLLKQFPALKPLVAAAIGEGLMIAGQSAESTRGETADKLLTPKQAGLALASGVAGGTIGILGGKIAQKLGIADIDTAIAQGSLQSSLKKSGMPDHMIARVLAGAGTEGVLEEMPQSAVEQIAQNVALSKPWDEGVPEASAIGMLAGMAVGGPTAAFSRAKPEEKLNRAVNDAAADTLNTMAKAAQAEAHRDVLEKFGKAASEEPLRKTSPSAFQEFVKTMSDEDGAISELFVDADRLEEAFAQSGLTEQELNEKMPDVARELAVAKDTGGQVRIGIEDYATHIAGSAAEGPLLDHVRTSPDGMTYAESQSYYQEQEKQLTEQAKRIAEEHQPVLSREEFEQQPIEARQDQNYEDYLKGHANQVEVFARDAKSVHDTILAGLNNTGRFTSAINGLYAIPFREFYATNAARLKILPSELYKQMPLNFQKMTMENALSQFAGPNALTADTLSLENAKARLEQGDDAEQVRQDTGWHQGVDGLWRFEIDDSQARLTLPELSDTHTQQMDYTRLSQLLDHPRLFAAYPQLANMRVFYNIQHGADVSGEFNPVAREIRITAPSNQEALSALLHEVQHAIQTAEGFAPGGSPSLIEKLSALRQSYGEQRETYSRDIGFNRWENELLENDTERFDALLEQSKATQSLEPAYRAFANEMLPQDRREPFVQRMLGYDKAIREVRGMHNVTPFEGYLRLAGEIEARNTQQRHRLGMNEEERRAIPPSATQDRPDDQAIIVHNGRVVDHMPANMLSQPPEYGMTHRPPGPDGGAPAHDLTGNGQVYPDDVYSSRAVQYYGTGEDKMDRAAFALLHKLKGKPDAMVTIYRAIPANLDGAISINPGDWVTINRTYAKEHGLGFPEGYKILSKKVKAREIFTKGDSVQEWGYWPSDSFSLYQTAFHGSPHRFDRFTTGAIGTGEGAQAYGHGLYFADSRDVAEHYRKKLTSSTDGPPKRFHKGVELKPLTPEYHAATLLSRNGMTLASARKDVAEWIAEGENDPRLVNEVKDWKRTLEFLNQAKRKSEFTEKPYEGQLYQVELAPDPDQYLLWDKPLNEQSDAVKQALRGLSFAPDEEVWTHWTGEQLHESELALRVEFDGLTKPQARQRIAQELHSLGIRGIKYLDGSSRSQGEGAYNYVIFHEDDVAITNTFYQSAFYSALERTIGGLKKIANKEGLVKVGEARNWLKSRQQSGDFRKEEVEAIGLDEWLTLQGDRVAVSDVERFVREHGVQVIDVMHDNDDVEAIAQQIRDAAEPAEYDNSEQDPYAWNVTYHGDTFELSRDPDLMLDEELLDEVMAEYNPDDEGEIYTLAREIRHSSEALYDDEELGDPISWRVTYNGETHTLDRDPFDFAADELLEELGISSNETHFERFTLDGGENYRELALVLPSRRVDAYQVAEQMFGKSLSELTDEEVQAANAEFQRRRAVEEEDYHVPSAHHMSDAANVNRLAHIRFNDRTGPDGAKVLFIEEIQSDWGQLGRDKGFLKSPTPEQRERYKELLDKSSRLGGGLSAIESGLKEGEPYPAEYDELLRKREEVIAELKQLNDSANFSGKAAPPGPFVTDTKSWVALSMKRMLAYAAENGYQRIAWTTGAQQAARYDLSKQVSKITIIRPPVGSESNGYSMLAYDNDGDNVSTQRLQESELEDTIGKELAKKAVEQEPGSRVDYTGVDLAVGGEGMREFYDKIVPQVANDILKKLKAGKVGVVQMGEARESEPNYILDHNPIGEPILRFPSADGIAPQYVRSTSRGTMTTDPMEAQTFTSESVARSFIHDPSVPDPAKLGPQLSIELTPELKEKVLQGLPLFNTQRRAEYDPSSFTISLLKGADLSSVIHEGGHFYLEALADLAMRPDAPQQIKDDFRKTLDWFGIKGDESLPNLPNLPNGTLGQTAPLPPFITIGGIDRPTTNSNGQLLAQTEEGIRNFWAWFGNSAAHEPHYSTKQDRKKLKPMVFYHTTKGDFDKFEIGRTTVNSGTFGSWETFRSAVFTTPSLTDSQAYGTEGSKFVPGANVMPLYVKAEHPLDLTNGIDEQDAARLEAAGMSTRFIYSRQLGAWDMFDDEQGRETVEMIKAAGFDSVVFNDENPDTGDSFESWALFDPAQIKSALGNDGTFDPANPNILRQGGPTPEGQPLPQGRTPEEVWAAMSLEQKRQYHEQWAQSFERYALEGKAPTVEMQPVFARFRAWMINIYKSIKEFLKQNPLAGRLNDDIRAVFDRLIASEEAILAAEKARFYAALFTSAEEAGTTPKQFEEYLEQGKLATEQAIAEMMSRSLRDMKWASNAQERVIRKLQKEAKDKRDAIRRQVEAEVMQEPINRVRSYFKTGKFFDDNGQEVEAPLAAKLSRAEIKSLVPDADMNKLRGMTSKDGIALDLAAQLFGLESGAVLLDGLLNGEDPKAKIDGITDQRMLEQHGDLIDERAVKRAAEEAIHNEARARFMATGLKLLMDSQPKEGKRKTSEASAALLNKAARQAAESAIAAKRVREISVAQYTKAEQKANQEALKHAPKSPDKAIQAQRAALLNNRLARAAGEALSEVDTILRYFKKFQEEGPRKKLDLDYMEQIDDLLSGYDTRKLSLKQIDKNRSLADWIDEQEANGFEPAIDAARMEEVKRKHYKDMTIEELRGLRDAVKQVEHLGRLKKKLLTLKDEREFQAIVDEAEESIRDHANRTVPERGTPTDIVGMTAQWARQMLASHRKFNSIIREMDGGQDGGTMWNLLSRGMNAAGDEETERKQLAAQTLATLFEALPKENGAGNLRAKKKLIPGTVGLGSGGIALTQEQRIMFALNWGNLGNRQRLLDGGITGKRALSTGEAQAVLDTLTKAEWDFVQSIWDFIATHKDEIAALERKLTGVEPEWIEPAPIATRFGSYRGGYFPAKYDTELSSRSESLEAVTDLRMGMKGAFNSAATRSGYTKARADKVINRPLLLSYNVISSHVNEVIHRLSWQPWLVDANRLLKALDIPIREHYGPEILRELRDTVVDIAQGDAPAKNATEQAINRLRVGSTIVGMGWKFSTALLQPTGIAQSWVRIGGRWAAVGVAKYVANPNAAAQFVDAQSSLMKNRAITMQREINEVLNTVRAGKALSNLQASFFYLIGKMQRTVDIPTWLGAREKALHELHYERAPDEAARKRIEEEAVARADQAVIDSQSGGQLKDLAKVQRGSPIFKLFTNFYSYFSATYNLNVEAVRRTHFRRPTEVAILAGDLVMLNIIPVLFSVALKQLTKGKCSPDDLECLASEYASEQISFLFGQMILLREAGSAINVATGGDGFGYQGPAGLRFFSDLYKAGQQAGQGEVDMPLFKSFNNVAGAILHYPAGQINSTLEGILAIEEGRVEGLAIGPALLFGPPKD